MTMTDESSFTPESSPLSEVQPESIDLFIERINAHLLASVPERITDDDLTSLANFYRREAEQWAIAEATKTPRAKRQPAAPIAVDISEFDL